MRKTLSERRCVIGVMKKTLWESRFEKDFVRGRCMKHMARKSFLGRCCEKKVVAKTLRESRCKKDVVRNTL